MGTQTLRKKSTTKPKAKSSRPAPVALRPVPDSRRWLKISEVATYLGLATHHCYKMHRLGQLPSFKLPGLGVRVDKIALEAKIQSVKDARAAVAGTSWPSI